MDRVRFGKTGLMVSKIAFGAIPIQRVSTEDAVKVVRTAISEGINFIDTANGYTNSEERIGLAIKDIPRESVVIASKSLAKDKETFARHIDLSLSRLGVDYIDIYQLHHLSSEASYNAVFGEGGAFEALADAVRAGKVRFPAFSSHNAAFAVRVMREGKFAAVQLPFNYLEDEAALEAIPLAREMDIGFISMKPFGGGMLPMPDAGLALRYLFQYEGIVPDPGIETLAELEEVVGIIKSGEKFSQADAAAVREIKEKAGGRWCHRCEYCLPCPQNIGISALLTVESLIKRMPFARAFEMVGEKIRPAPNCTGCRECVERCPYNLDIPELVRENLAVWNQYVSENS